MSYDTFIEKVTNVFGRDAHKTSFKHEDGRHIARIYDILITGNTGSRKLTVRWGDGHVGLIEI